MRRGVSLSNRSKWIIVLALLAAHPLMLTLLFPVMGGAANTVSFVVPVTATLFFGLRTGAAFLMLNTMAVSVVFGNLSQLTLLEALPRAVLNVLVDTIACLGADRIKRFMEQRKAVEEQLHQAQKLEALGRLAGGVAHDMNNTLNVIMGSVFALRHELSGYARRFEDLENIAAACDRGSQLTRNLLGFARRTNYENRVFSLNAVAEGMMALLGRTASKSIRVETELAEVPPLIQGDRGQLENAIMNLCVNALDALEAMDAPGLLRIATGRTDGRVFISVADTGPGMNEETKKRAFEPFFTTKPLGQGTGLGLSIVYGVASAMGGSVVLESALGQGTTISLAFPEAVETTAPASTTSVPGIVRDELDALRGRLVLIVDDEPLVLRAGIRVLRTLGAEVISASSGQEGLELFTQHHEKLVLTIVDLIMPEIDGMTTVERILTFDPTARLLLVSGYTAQTDKLAAFRAKYPSVGFLAKPYQPAQLLSIAKRHLVPSEGAASTLAAPPSAAGGCST